MIVRHIRGICSRRVSARSSRLPRAVLCCQRPRAPPSKHAPASAHLAARSGLDIRPFCTCLTKYQESAACYRPAAVFPTLGTRLDLANAVCFWPNKRKQTRLHQPSNVDTFRMQHQETSSPATPAPLFFHSRTMRPCLTCITSPRFRRRQRCARDGKTPLQMR
jgi:hypothetical protein